MVEVRKLGTITRSLTQGRLLSAARQPHIWSWREEKKIGEKIRRKRKGQGHPRSKRYAPRADWILLFDQIRPFTQSGHRMAYATEELDPKCAEFVDMNVKYNIRPLLEHFNPPSMIKSTAQVISVSRGWALAGGFEMVDWGATKTSS